MIRPDQYSKFRLFTLSIASLLSLLFLISPLSLFSQDSSPPSYDFNGNGVVDIPDFLLFVNAFGSKKGQKKYDAKYDLDGNGEIGVGDFLLFMDNFGKTVNDNDDPAPPPPSPPPPPTPPIGGPDLSISVTGSREVAGIGQQFSTTKTVHNRGDADSPPLIVRSYISRDATITTGDRLLSISVEFVVEAGGSKRLEGVPVWHQNSGTHYYGSCVFPPEDSNLRPFCSESVSVLVKPSDLVVQSVSVSSTDLVRGAQFTLSTTVENRGGGRYLAGVYHSPPVHLRYYRSTDPTISTDDTEVGTDSVGSLSASGTEANSIDLTAPSTPGTYYYGACVDPVLSQPAPITNEGESNTRNNCSGSVRVAVSPPAAPDLEVASFSVDDATPRPEATFTLSATVTNSGGVGAEATTLRYYRSTDSDVTTSDTEVGTGAVSALAAGGESEQSIDLTAPSEEGTYYYAMCVDAVADESDTSNNCSAAVGVTVTKIGPDLTVTVTEPDEAILAGENFYLTATVTNDGDKNAGSTWINFYRSRDRTITTSDEVVSEFTYIDGLAPGKSVTQRSFYHIIAPSSAGTYYYGACVDPPRGESDTKNNCSAAVEVTVKAWVDLSVQSMGYGMDFESPRVGGTFPMNASVENRGSKESGDTTLRFYRSADATITTSDTEVGTAEVSSLEAGERHSYYRVTITVPSTEGTYYYGACVDVVTDESDTKNNCYGSSYEIPVPLPRPDLTVGMPSVDDASLDTGTTFTLSATVTNVGDWPTGTTLRYYRSTDETITTSDTEVGTDKIGFLLEDGTSAESISLTAPSMAGTYYYGACADAVKGEPDTSNNCSASVKVDVEAP